MGKTVGHTPLPDTIRAMASPRAANPTDLSRSASSCKHSIAIATPLSKALKAYRAALHAEETYQWKGMGDTTDLDLWNARNDARDELLLCLMADCGLPKADAQYLMEEVI